MSQYIPPPTDTRSSTPSTAIGNDSIGPSPPPSPSNNINERHQPQKTIAVPAQRQSFGPRVPPPPTHTDTTTTTTTATTLTSTINGGSASSGSKHMKEERGDYNGDQSLDESFADVALRCRALLTYAPTTPELKRRQKQVESQKLLNEELEMRIRQLKGEVLKFDSGIDSSFGSDRRQKHNMGDSNKQSSSNGGFLPPPPAPRLSGANVSTIIGTPIGGANVSRVEDAKGVARAGTIILPDAERISIRNRSQLAPPSITRGQERGNVGTTKSPSEGNFTSHHLQPTLGLQAALSPVKVSSFPPSTISTPTYLSMKETTGSVTGLNVEMATDEIYKPLPTQQEPQQNIKHFKLPPPPKDSRLSSSEDQHEKEVMAAEGSSRQKAPPMVEPTGSATRNVSPPRPSSQTYYQQLSGSFPQKVPQYKKAVPQAEGYPTSQVPLNLPDSANASTQYLAAARSQIWQNERYTATAALRDTRLSERLERAGSSRSASVSSAPNNTNERYQVHAGDTTSSPSINQVFESSEQSSNTKNVSVGKIAIFPPSSSSGGMGHILSPDTNDFEYQFPSLAAAPLTTTTATPMISSSYQATADRSPTAKAPTDAQLAAATVKYSHNDNVKGLYSDPTPTDSLIIPPSHAQPDSLSVGQPLPNNILPSSSSTGTIPSSLDDYVRAAVLTQVQLLAELAAADEAKQRQLAQKEAAEKALTDRMAGGLMLLNDGDEINNKKGGDINHSNLLLLPLSGQEGVNYRDKNNSATSLLMVAEGGAATVPATTAASGALSELTTPTSVILDNNPLNRVSRFHQTTTDGYGVSLLRYNNHASSAAATVVAAVGGVSPTPRKKGYEVDVMGFTSPPKSTPSRSERAAQALLILRQQQKEKRELLERNKAVWGGTRSTDERNLKFDQDQKHRGSVISNSTNPLHANSSINLNVSGTSASDSVGTAPFETSNRSTTMAAHYNKNMMTGAKHQSDDYTSLNKSPQRQRKGSIEAPPDAATTVEGMTSEMENTAKDWEVGTSPLVQQTEEGSGATHLARSGASITSEDDGPATIEILGGSLDRGGATSPDEGVRPVHSRGTTNGGRHLRKSIVLTDDGLLIANQSDSAGSPTILISTTLTEEPKLLNTVGSDQPSDKMGLKRPLSPDRDSPRLVMSPTRSGRPTDEFMSEASNRNATSAPPQERIERSPPSRHTSPSRSDIRDLSNTDPTTTLRKNNPIHSPSSNAITELVARPPVRKFLSPLLEEEKQDAESKMSAVKQTLPPSMDGDNETGEVSADTGDRRPPSAVSRLSPNNMPTPPSAPPSKAGGSASTIPSSRPPLASRPPPSPTSRSNSNAPPTPTNGNASSSGVRSPPTLTADAATMTNSMVPPMASLTSMDEVLGAREGGGKVENSDEEISNHTKAWPDGRIHKGGPPPGVPVIRRVSLVSGTVAKDDPIQGHRRSSQAGDGAPQASAIVSVNGNNNNMGTKRNSTTPTGHINANNAQKGVRSSSPLSAVVATAIPVDIPNPAVVTQQEFKRMLQTAWAGGSSGGLINNISSGQTSQAGQDIQRSLNGVLSPQQRGYYTAGDFAKEPRYFSSGTGHVTQGSSPQRKRSGSTSPSRSATKKADTEKANGDISVAKGTKKTNKASTIAEILCCKPVEEPLYEDSEENAIIINNQRLLTVVAEDERNQQNFGASYRGSPCTTNASTGRPIPQGPTNYVTPRQSLVMLAAGIISSQPVAQPSIQTQQQPRNSISNTNEVKIDGGDSVNKNNNDVKEDPNPQDRNGSIAMLSSATVSTTRPPTPRSANNSSPNLATPLSATVPGTSSLGAVGKASLDGEMQNTSAHDRRRSSSNVVLSASANNKVTEEATNNAKNSSSLLFSGRKESSNALKASPQSPLIPLQAAQNASRSLVGGDDAGGPTAPSAPSGHKRIVVRKSNLSTSSRIITPTNHNNLDQNSESIKATTNPTLQRSLSKASSSATVNLPPQSEDQSSTHQGYRGGPPSVSATENHRQGSPAKRTSMNSVATESTSATTTTYPTTTTPGKGNPNNSPQRAAASTNNLSTTSSHAGANDSHLTLVRKRMNQLGLDASIDTLSEDVPSIKKIS